MSSSEEPEWLFVMADRIIDEYLDVNEGEKQFMKMWNLHIMQNNYVGDLHVPLACKEFVKLHGKELVSKLYNNSCLHFTNLFDFGLLSAQDVHEIITLLQSHKIHTGSSTAVRLETCTNNNVGSSSTDTVVIPAQTSANSIVSDTSTAKLLPLQTSSNNNINITAACVSASSSAAITIDNANSKGSTSMKWKTIHKLEFKDEFPKKKGLYSWMGGLYNCGDEYGDDA